MEAEQMFDHEVDVIVVGSGAGGMTTAWTAKHLGLDVLIVEKGELFGGSTALSGGGAWIPNAPVLLREGQRDDPEQVFRYLRTIAPDVAPERQRMYVEQAPKMVETLETTTPFFKNGFFWGKGYSDYHPDKGGSPLGRGLWASPIDLRRLGADGAALRGGLARVPGAPRGMWLTSVDFYDLTHLRWGGSRGLRALGRLAWRTVESRVRGTRMVASGAALITRLRLALKQAGVPLWLNTPMKELITDDEGRVLGVLVERDGRLQRIRGRLGVVIATGGFEHNEKMRSGYQPEVGKGWSAGSPENQGDGQRAGEAIGAALSLMDDAWWMPGMQLPAGVFGLVAERSYPNQFIVNSAGKRFTNESGPYCDFVHDQLAGHRAGVSHIPVYMIIDHWAWTHNLIAGHLPGRRMPKAWLESGSVHKADSLEELARRIGVPEADLVATAARFNEMARNGRDEDFHRGESAYDRYYGNPSYPNPNLGEVNRPPYYAFTLVPGDLGTKGGLLTDEHARVLREDESVIPGLYATGNASASVMGNDYAGPGATIGPAMTFGWVAAHHIAETVRREAATAATRMQDAGASPTRP